MLAAEGPSERARSEPAGTGSADGGHGLGLRLEAVHQDGGRPDEGEVRDEQDEPVYPGHEHQRKELHRPHRGRDCSTTAGDHLRGIS